MKTSMTQWLRRIALRFWPHAIVVGKKEILFSCVGGAIGLVLTEWIGHHYIGTDNPWFIAPMGASAVLLFGVPTSPLAQPWSIVGGNLIAALVGVIVCAFIPYPGYAVGIGFALAMGLMFKLRCLHPPSGAVVLTVILGGNSIRQLGYHFVLYPVLLNSLSLVSIALLFNNAVRRRYPHQLAPDEKTEHLQRSLPNSSGITREDLHAVLSNGEFFDIDADDLEIILNQAEYYALKRNANVTG